MVIASHDRHFLDASTTHTLFLRPGVSRSYAHPYSRARHLLAEDDAAQEAKLAKETREVNRLRRNANELKNVGINSGSDLLLKKSKQLRNARQHWNSRCRQHILNAPVTFASPTEAPMRR